MSIRACSEITSNSQMERPIPPKPPKLSFINYRNVESIPELELPPAASNLSGSRFSSFDNKMNRIAEKIAGISIQNSDKP